MNTSVRIAVAAAAVVMIALIGANLVPRSGVVGAPSPTVLPTATAVPTPMAMPSPVAGGAAALQPGTYTAAEPFLLHATFTVPAGWEGTIGGPYGVFLEQAQGPGAVSLSIFDKVYADPCHYKGLLDPLPGPSVDDLAAALAGVPGLGNPTPADVTVSGYRGKLLTLTAPASFAGCALTPDGKFRVWELPLGATMDMEPGQQDRVWILDVGGERLVVDAPQVQGEAAASAAEVQGVLDSLRIAPLN